MADPTGGLLGTAIDPTVTLYIADLRKMPPDIRAYTVELWTAAAADEIASNGDKLIHRGRKKGQTARVFDRLARGLAAAAWQPGGASFAGNHWCTGPHDNCPNGKTHTD